MKKDNSHIFPTPEMASKMPKYNPELPPLSGEILGRFHHCSPRMTMEKFVYFTGAHRNTIKKHIDELIRIGLMRKHGKGRATWYTL